jgi:hypothetical protein
MKTYVAAADVEQWEPLIEWLEKPSSARAPAAQSPPTPAIASI